MTVSRHGVEGQLISEARICIISDIKALNCWSHTKISSVSFLSQLQVKIICHNFINLDAVLLSSRSLQRIILSALPV